jgi:hypothetical protein
MVIESAMEYVTYQALSLLYCQLPRSYALLQSYSHVSRSPVPHLLPFPLPPTPDLLTHTSLTHHPRFPQVPTPPFRLRPQASQWVSLAPAVAWARPELSTIFARCVNRYVHNDFVVDGIVP